MKQYAIRKDDGTMVLDSGWHCEADVLGAYHGFGVSRVYGSLVMRDSDDDEWRDVHPTDKKKEATHGHQ
jgi:hypothetical protein